MEDQIKGIQEELKKSREDVAESVALKVKRSMPPEFRRKKQFKFNAEKIQRAARTASYRGPSRCCCCECPHWIKQRRPSKKV